MTTVRILPAVAADVAEAANWYDQNGYVGLGARLELAKKQDTPGTMNQRAVIRDETDADASTITAVTIAAFETLEISNKTEQYILEALRAAKALTVSLVAEVDSRVVGHIAFSPVTISDGSRDWYGLESNVPDHPTFHLGHQ